METENQQEKPPQKDSNKIYLLIVVILLLLGTNAYLFFKDKQANERIVTVSDEKTRLETEIDKIEAELDNANSNNVELSTQMNQEQELARQKIAQLREDLRKGKLNQGQLTKAQEDIKQLRYFVTKYAADIDELKQQNASLTTERNTLRTTVDSVSTLANSYEKKNEELNAKVKVAAALKTAGITIIPLRIKNSGKVTDVTRASSTEKLRISFLIAPNTVADKGMHDIYLRIIDPSGNLVVNGNQNMFMADEEDMQYTYKTAVEFANDGKQFSIDWTNPSEFQKGTYTIILYADGYTMGKASLNLK